MAGWERQPADELSTGKGLLEVGEGEVEAVGSSRPLTRVRRPAAPTEKNAFGRKGLHHERELLRPKDDKMKI